MGHSERKEKERRIRQEDIIHAAEKVFFLKGYEQTTMDEIAKTAEYSKRTIYSYFQSKEQLLHAIIYRAYRTLNELVSKELSAQPELSGLSKLLLMGETFIRFMSQYPKYFETIVFYNSSKSELSTDDPFRKASDSEGNLTMEILLDTIAKGIQDGSIRGDLDVRKTAFVLYANITGIANLLLNKESYLLEHHLPAKELVREMFRFVERSITKD